MITLSNRGAAGGDGMTIDERWPHCQQWSRHREEFFQRNVLSRPRAKVRSTDAREQLKTHAGHSDGSRAPDLANSVPSTHPAIRTTVYGLQPRGSARSDRPLSFGANQRGHRIGPALGREHGPGEVLQTCRL